MAALDSAVAHVRDEAAAALQRDQTLLASQRELVAELGSVTRGLADDSAQYRSTLERFSEHTSGLLQSTAAGFAASVEQGADRLAEVSEQFAAGAIELATLGDAMGGAVAQFDAVSAHLSSTLQGVAQGMQEAAGRSDEQLAYYVAQAREVIDHSALAQQKLLDQLREISRSV
jgi:ABC-type transporter Mla subunit MlaD